MDKLLTTLNEYLQAAGKLIVAHSPQVWDATLQLIQLSAIWSLVTWLLWMASATVFGVICMKRTFGDGDLAELWFFGAMISAVVFGIGVIAAACSGFETILGIGWPQLALLYRLGSKLGVF